MPKVQREALGRIAVLIGIALIIYSIGVGNVLVFFMWLAIVASLWIFNFVAILILAALHKIIKDRRVGKYHARP